jgi:PKD repeat protein
MTLRSAALVLVFGAASACSYHAPTLPDAVPFNEATPTTLTLNATAGTGPSGGTASIVARVQNGRGSNLGGFRVQFTTDAGSLSTPSVETLADGTASLMLTAATTATVIATAGTLTTRALVQSNPNVPIVSPGPDGPEPPRPGPPAPSPLTVTLLVTPGDTGTATTFGLNSPGISRAVWTFGDGASATTTAPSASHVYTAAGSYTASVTITDTIGRTASNSATFAIADTPPPPPPPAPSYSVTLTVIPSSVLVAVSTTLTATVIPQNGAPAPTTYAWTFGDGTTTTTATSTTTHAYATPRTFTASVTATGGTVSGSASTPVTVTAVVPLFTAAGTGSDVIQLPTTMTLVRITATYLGNSAVFSVTIAGGPTMNDVVGTGQPSTTIAGTFPTHGGTAVISTSSTVTWTFTEVR